MALYVKAFSLVLKTVSKPMAKSLKSFVVSQPELKKTCISMAQKINVLYSYVVLEAPIPKPTTWNRRSRAWYCAISSSNKRKKMTRIVCNC